MVEIPIYLVVIFLVLLVIFIVAGIVNGFKWDTTKEKLKNQTINYERQLEASNLANEKLNNIRRIAPNLFSLFDMNEMYLSYSNTWRNRHGWDGAKLARVAAKLNGPDKDTDDTIELLKLGEF